LSCAKIVVNPDWLEMCKVLSGWAFRKALSKDLAVYYGKRFLGIPMDFIDPFLPGIISMRSHLSGM